MTLLSEEYSVWMTHMKACCKWFSHLLLTFFFFLNQNLDMRTETAGVSEHQRETQRTYLLTIFLKEGRGLVIRDRCGECQISMYKHNTPWSTTHILIAISGLWIGAYLLRCSLSQCRCVKVTCVFLSLKYFFLPEFTI